MKLIGKIFKDDVKQFFTSFFIIVIILGITVIPALYAWLNIYSNWDPYGNTAGLKIAFYSADEGYTADGVSENVGASLEDELKENDAVTWVFTKSEDAAVRGVHSGKYYAAIVIEKDFTYRILNFFMDGVDKPSILFYQNQKKNPVATKISDAVITKVHKSLNKKLTGVIVEQVFDTANAVENNINAAGGIEGVVTDMNDLNDQIKDYQKTIETVIRGNEVLLSAIQEGKIDAAKTGDDISNAKAALDDTEGQISATELTLDFYMDNVKQTLDSAQGHLYSAEQTLRQGKVSDDVTTMGKAVSNAATDMNALMDDIDVLNKTIGQQYMPDTGKYFPTKDEVKNSRDAAYATSDALQKSSEQMAKNASGLRDYANNEDNVENLYNAEVRALEISAASADQAVTDAQKQLTEDELKYGANPAEGTEGYNIIQADKEALAKAEDAQTSAHTALEKAQKDPEGEKKNIKANIDNAATVMETGSASLADASTYSKKAGDAFDNIYQHYDQYKAAAENIGSVIGAYYDSLAAIRTQLNNMVAQTAGDTAVTDTVLTEKALADEIDAVLKELSTTEYTFEYSIRPGVDMTLESLAKTVGDIGDMLDSLSKTVYGMGNVFDALSVSLTSAQDSLGKTDDLLGIISDRLTTVTGKVEDIENSDELQILMNTLAGDPEKYSDFFSEPVQINDNVIYPVANYGSAVTPFYTILSIWVGALVIAAILKAKVKSGKYPGATQAQLYFGRYLSFLLIAELQTLVTVIGDLFVFKVQCLHPFLFWFGCAYTGMVFSLLIYSLVLAFGDVGKAIAVVAVVIQIAGSSGTYPIELLPDFFQKVYLFFPFPYAINALRETIGGLYDGYFALYLLQLSIFIPVSLVIGLLIRRPFRGFNKFMYKRMEDSSLF